MLKSFINKFYKLLYPSNIKIEGKCSKCGSCCQKIYLYVDNKIMPDEDTFYQMQEEFPFYKNLLIAGRNAKDELYFKCGLSKDNLCLKYEKRPFICREYPSTRMFRLGGTLHESCSFRIKARKEFKFYLDNYMQR